MADGLKVRKVARAGVAGTVSMDALRQMLDRGEKVTVLDVRDADDFAEWHIPGATSVDVYEDLSRGSPGRLATIETIPRDAPVVAVCYAGVTSRIAAEALRQRGYEATSLQGGMNGWSLAWNTADVPLTGETAVVQVRRTGKGCLSYVVGNGSEAAVVDPSAEPSVYLDLARSRGWTIKRVLETHVHADHLSRARQLAAATGATLHMPRTDRISFPAEAVDDGARIPLGTDAIFAIHTPGHTDESTCYHLGGRALFTGDTLFLDSIGRPDLETSAEGAARRAGALHESLARLVKLHPMTLVLPCHVNVPIPFDRVALVARLGEVKERVPMLSLAKDAFVKEILARLPPTPPNHRVIVAANERGETTGLDPRIEAGANRCAIK